MTIIFSSFPIFCRAKILVLNLKAIIYADTGDKFFIPGSEQLFYIDYISHVGVTCTMEKLGTEGVQLRCDIKDFEVLSNNMLDTFHKYYCKILISLLPNTDDITA